VRGDIGTKWRIVRIQFSLILRSELIRKDRMMGTDVPCQVEVFGATQIGRLAVVSAARAGAPLDIANRHAIRCRMVTQRVTTELKTLESGRRKKT
jgi:hypothetical protein